MKRYQIKKHHLILNDAETVKFHVDKKDYFATIATILSLIEQDLQTIKCKDDKELVNINIVLKNLENDLIHLQKHYNISKQKLEQTENKK